MLARHPRLGLILLLLGACPAACVGPRATIEELGHPTFVADLGTTSLELVNPGQRGGLDAFAQGCDSRSEHRAQLMTTAAGTEEHVLVAVGVEPRPGSAPLRCLSAAAFPLRAEDLQAYDRGGQLPHPDEPLLYAQGLPSDGSEGITLLLRIPRERIPPRTARLAVPLLLQFEDRWIHLRFYHCALPPPADLTEEGPERER